jgi:hypothetical protein
MSRRFLLACAALNTAIYAALAVMYPLGAGLLKPRLTWAQQAGALPQQGLAHALIYAALFAVYAIAVWRIAQSPAARTSHLVALIVAGWLAGSLALLWSFPGESADVFDYLFRGRMLAEYNLSPLDTTPASISNKPFHRYIAWSAWVDAYGPVWEYASAAVSWLAAKTATPAEMRVVINQTCDVQPALCTLLAKYITGYRLLAMALAGVCGLLLFANVQRRTGEPVRATAALLAWLWNPLVIVSTAAGAHNDVLMLVFVLLAVWCAQGRRWLPALLLLGVAAHVKITALVALPVMCLWMAHQAGWRRAIITTLLSVAIMLPVSFMLYQPLGGWATLPRNLHERSLLSVNSLGELAYRALRETGRLGRPIAQRLASRAALVAFALTSAVILLVAWRRKPVDPIAPSTPDYWARVMAIVTLAYLALGSFWFQAWYLVLPVMLVALLQPPAPRLLRMVIAFCAGALLASVAADYLRAADVVPSGWVSILTVALTLAPAFVAGLARPPTSTR